MTDTSTPAVNTVTWWEIPVSDIEAAKAFYGNVFGWTFASFGDDSAYAGIESGGDLIGGLYRSDAPPTEEAGVRVYVNVSDLEEVLRTAETRGGRVKTPRAEVGGDMGWWAELSDPDGRRLGLCSGNPAAR